jgi:hypothetical protein
MPIPYSWQVTWVDPSIHDRRGVRAAECGDRRNAVYAPPHTAALILVTA